MADHAQPVALDDVESALIRAIYGHGKAWRPNGHAVVAVAIPHGDPMPRRIRANLHAEVRAFVGAATGYGWPWAAARIATWREDLAALRGDGARPVRVLRISNGIVVGEEMAGSSAYAGVMRHLVGTTT